MKLYSALKPMVVYTENELVLPKGDKIGFGNAVFLLNPNKDSGFSELTNGFLNYKKSIYKNYMIDFVYKDKIGFKKYVKNNTGVFKKEFTEMDTPANLRLVTNGNKVSILNKKLNVLVNLGEWNNIYFTYQVKGSFEKICNNYFKFIEKRVYDKSFEDYNKYIFINTDAWITNSNKLSFNRKDLTNPVSLFLITLYKFPEMFLTFQNCDFIFGSENNHKIMVIKGENLIKKNYPRIKQKLFSLINKEFIDESSINENIIDGVPIDKPIDKMTNDEVIQYIAAPLKETPAMKEKRDEIISSLSKNLMGDVYDVTKDIDDEDNSDINTDDDKINEIKNIANNYLDEHPELLDSDSTTAINEVEDAVKRKYYIKSFTPKYTDKQLETIRELTEIQGKTIGDMNQSIEDLESKIIDESDFSDILDTNNPNIVKSKFRNFGNSYVKKKLQKDIDNCVGQLSNATTKVFVVDKKEEDTSTPLDLKKTIHYTLEDENGRKMNIKFDVPIIFDDHFMMIKGNKKIIQNVLILKPLVKTGKDTVQIATNYNKMFVTRKGSVDVKTNALLRFLKLNSDEYEVVTGNGVATNTDYRSTLEYNAIAKKIIQFKIGNKLFILNTPTLFEKLDEMKVGYSQINLKKKIIIGIDLEKKVPIVMDPTKSFIDRIISYMPEEDVLDVNNLSKRSNGGRLLMYSQTKLLNKYVPVVLLLFYFEGFKTIMNKAGVEYEIIPKTDQRVDVDLAEWGLTELEDGYIKWKRYPSENSLLMNGLNSLPMHLYSIKELESKDMYTYLLTNIYNFANQAFNIDQYYDFMIDPITKEVLIDMKLPTDLVGLLILANKMLKSDDHTIESDLSSMRLRGNEIIAYHTYKAITESYIKYRKTQHKRKPDPITIKQDAVISKLMKQPASGMNEASSLNPILEISKIRAVSYKGEGGTNEDHALKLSVRAYNDSMLGVLGITTSNDGNVGVNRLLTLEPTITSTRGYIDTATLDNVEELNAANLLTPSEMLTPLGVQHDDPARTAMAWKQAIATLLVDDSDPVLIGNGVEKALPYHLSTEFSVPAEENGTVVEKNDKFMVIKYKSGKYRTIDLSPQIKKNSASGFYISTQLITNKNNGDKVKKNEIVAWDNRAYSKDGDSPEVSMNLGPLIKFAVIPEWDIYEDSAPISHNASNKMITTMIMPVKVSLKKDAVISRMVKIGDHVDAGDTVILFDDYGGDDDVKQMLAELRGDLEEEIIESNATAKKTHYTGTVLDIDIISTVSLDDMSESLREVVGEYWKNLRKKEKFLDKYSNSDDLKYYKSGNLITNSSGPVKPDSQGKVRGTKVDDGVVITFYIGYKDVMKRGDKLAAQFALKSITSHVIDEGLEPFSETRPEEPIDLITAPLSISARKTPSIFLSMFGNKILIESKRHLKDYWNNN